MDSFTDAELLNAIQKVVTKVIENREWNSGMSVSSLRDILRTKGHEPFSPAIIKSANPEPMKEALCELPELKWDELIDQLDLDGLSTNAPQ